MEALKVLEIKDNPDGSALVTFEVSDEFKAWFLKYFKLKRWSNKKFEKFVLNAIKTGLEKEDE